MAWTSPQTWTSALVTVDEMNEQVRDNLLALKDPPTDLVIANEGADYTTTSTSFADVDSAGDPDMSVTIETAGGDVLLVLTCTIGNSGGRTYLDIHESSGGARLGGDDGIVAHDPGTTNKNITVVWLAQGLSAGSHTFKVQWKVSAGTATMYAGAGTSNFDLHPQFFAREVS